METLRHYLGLRYTDAPLGYTSIQRLIAGKEGDSYP